MLAKALEEGCPAIYDDASGASGARNPMSPWSIRKKSDACVACEREFAVDEALFSLLRATEEGLARQDLCQACFTARDEAEAAGDLFFWRTHQQEETKKGLAVDFDAVEGLFLALEGREERRLAELRYLLALLLMRKKRLKLVRILRRSDAEGMVMRRPRRDEALEVLVFDLTAERMAELREDLARIFEGAGAEEILTASHESDARPGAATEGDDVAEETPEESLDLQTSSQTAGKARRKGKGKSKRGVEPASDSASEGAPNAEATDLAVPVSVDVGEPENPPLDASGKG